MSSLSTISSQPATPPRTYRPELDSLRAIAIGIVMLHHYMKGVHFALSGFGVVLFFALSGYFGTRGLLGMRETLKRPDFSFAAGLKVFYGRRYLRIYPLHLLILTVTFIAGLEYARPKLLWNITFLANWGMLAEGEWWSRFSPLWSLSVLEQFYWIWPSLILLAPRRALQPVIFGAVALSIAGRFVALHWPLPSFAWTMVPTMGLDQLGLGALLAYWRSAPEHERKLHALRRVGGPVCGTLMGLVVLGRLFRWEPPYSAMFMTTLSSLFFVWLIDRTLRGFEGKLTGFLRFRWLAEAGKVSYGAFLIHSFTELLLYLIPFAPLQTLLLSPWKAVVLIPVTFSLAYLSWILLEEPIARFRKARFKSPTPHPDPAQAVVVAVESIRPGDSARRRR